MPSLRTPISHAELAQAVQWRSRQRKCCCGTNARVIIEVQALQGGPVAGVGCRQRTCKSCGTAVRQMAVYRLILLQAGQQPLTGAPPRNK
jgi:hypothetical protein